MDNPFDLNPFEDDDSNHGQLEEDVFLWSLVMAYNVMIYGRKKQKKRREKWLFQRG